MVDIFWAEWTKSPTCSWHSVSCWSQNEAIPGAKATLALNLLPSFLPQGNVLSSRVDKYQFRSNLFPRSAEISWSLFWPSAAKSEGDGTSKKVNISSADKSKFKNEIFHLNRTSLQQTWQIPGLFIVFLSIIAGWSIELLKNHLQDWRKKTLKLSKRQIENNWLDSLAEWMCFRWKKVSNVTVEANLVSCCQKHAAVSGVHEKHLGKL